MLKKIGACFLLVIMVSDVMAQKFQGGIVSGLSTSQVSGDLLSGFNKIGLIAGGYIKLELQQKNYLQFEIIYCEKGSSNPDLDNNIAEISLSYIDIPLSINIEQKNNISIQLGAFPSVLITSKMNDFYGNISIDPKFNKYDFSIFAGVNYKLTSKIILNTKISNSIIAIRPHISNVTQGINKGQYNTMLSFSIYYQIS